MLDKPVTTCVGNSCSSGCRLWCLYWCLFVLSFFLRDVLDEIWDLIGSVSESFPTYFYRACLVRAGVKLCILLFSLWVLRAGYWMWFFYVLVLLPIFLLVFLLVFLSFACLFTVDIWYNFNFFCRPQQTLTLFWPVIFTFWSGSFLVLGVSNECFYLFISVFSTEIP